MNNNAYYPALDGARGIAAIAVFIYHLSDYFGGIDWLQSSFLAVDVFFLMSGFVIALSYEQSLLNGTRSIKSFVLARALRLYPLYLMACCIGAGYFFIKYLTGAEGSPTLLQMLTALPAALLLAPWPSAAEWGFTPYPFAPSAWSLSLEFWYNILYALVAVHLRTRALLAISAVSSAALLHQASHWGSLDMGWSIATMIGGTARFWFSFSLGILIFRHRAKFLKKTRIFSYFSIACFAFVALPRESIALSMFWVSIVFPLALMGGAAYQFKGLAAVFCKHLGRLSYGIYILHTPIIIFQTGALKAILGDAWENHKALLGFSIILTVFFASWLCTYYVDEPLRRHLKRRLAKTQNVAPAPLLVA